MKDIKKGIYSLKHRALDGLESTLRIKCDNGKLREKFALTQLDALTTSCNSMEELLELISLINVPKKNSKDEFIDGYCYIEYRNNGNIKKLDIAFNDNEIIKEVSRSYEGKYNIKGTYQVKQLAMSLIKIHREKDPLYNYLNSCNVIDSDLSYYLCMYDAYTSSDYYNINEADAYLDLIIGKLSQYKIFRDITFEIHRYEEKTKSQISEINARAEKPKVKIILPRKIEQPRLFNPDDF